MDDIACKKLCEIIAEKGSSLCDEQLSCEGLLRDVLSEYPRERSVLISALKEQIPAALLQSSDREPRELLLSRLTKRLLDKHPLNEKAAKWGVESWALALGVISSKDWAMKMKKVGKSPSHISKKDITISPYELFETTVIVGIIVGGIIWGIITTEITWAMLGGFVGIVAGAIIGLVIKKVDIIFFGDSVREVAGGITGSIVGGMVGFLTSRAIDSVLGASFGLAIGISYSIIIKMMGKS